MGIYLFKIFQQTKMTRNMPLGFLISIVFASAPVIWKWIAKDESFFCHENLNIFALQWLVTFSLKFINFLLIRSVIILFEIKLFVKMHIMTMIDENFAINNNMTCILPKISIGNSGNFKQLLNFIQVMQKMDDI